MVALIDESDLSNVLGRRWWAHRVGRTWYVETKAADASGKRQTKRLHRLLMNAAGDAEVDHVNGDGLDNRRCNLRLATHAENGRNRRLAVNNTSGYRGVTWRKKEQKWSAKIRHDRRTHWLGLFDSPELAAAEYQKAAERLFGEFYRAL